MKILLFPIYFLIRRYLSLRTTWRLIKEKTFNRWKCVLLGYACKAEVTIGSNVRIGSAVHIQLGKNSRLHIGENVTIRNNSFIVLKAGAQLIMQTGSYLGPFSEVFCAEKIDIGEAALIAQHCIVIDYNHAWSPESGVVRKEFNTQPISIGKKAWIGAKSVVVAGTSLGDNCLLGAGSIAKGTYPAGQKVVNKS